MFSFPLDEWRHYGGLCANRPHAGRRDDFVREKSDPNRRSKKVGNPEIIPGGGT